MARTNKKKQRENKKRASNTPTLRFKNPRQRLSLTEAKERGIVVPRKNPDGHIFHWFVKGRKACYETKMKFDPDGYRFYKNDGGSWLCQDMRDALPRYARLRIRKIR